MLATARMFSEAELILENMKNQGWNPTVHALSDLTSAYSQAGLISKALDMFLYTKHPGFCCSAFSCKRLLNALVRGKQVNIAQKIYGEMLESDRSHPDNYSVSIVVQGLCMEGFTRQGS